MKKAFPCDSRQQITRSRSAESLKRSQLTETYWLSRIVILRYLGFIYFVAFAVALQQNSALIGPDGLTPATAYLARIGGHYGSSDYDRFMNMPTLFWFLAPTSEALNSVAVVGMALAGFVSYHGAANMPMLLALWLLYMLSLIHI